MLLIIGGTVDVYHFVHKEDFVSYFFGPNILGKDQSCFRLIIRFDKPLNHCHISHLNV